MRHLRIVGLCLVAVFLLGAVAAVSASAAEPALYECGKAGKETVEWKEGTPPHEKTKKKSVYTGHFEKGCTVENTTDNYRIKGAHPGPEGKYEVMEGIGKGKVFKGTGGRAELEVHSVGGIICQSSSDSGKFSSPKEASDIAVTFKGCEYIDTKCESKGAKAGEIKTNTLKGELGYIDAAKDEVGVDLTPESGTYEAEFTCEPQEMRVRGSVIGLVGPVNEFTKTSTLTFEQAYGKQGITRFEGGLEDTLLTEIGRHGKFDEEEPLASGQEGKAVNKGEELELKAS